MGFAPFGSHGLRPDHEFTMPKNVNEDKSPIKKEYLDNKSTDKVTADNYEDFVLYREFSNFRDNVFDDLQSVIAKIENTRECQHNIERKLDEYVAEARDYAATINSALTAMNNQRKEKMVEDMEDKRMSTELKIAIIAGASSAATAVITFLVEHFVVH